MILKCPKCGFEQPQDRYCASCGVDMETFRPPKPTLNKTIFAHPILVSVAILGVIGGVAIALKVGQPGPAINTKTTTIRIQPVQQQISTVSQTSLKVSAETKGTNANTTNATLASNPLPPKVEGETNKGLQGTHQPDTNQQNHPKNAGPSKSENPEGIEKPQNEGGANATQTKEANLHQLKVHYVEINNDLLKNMADEAHRVGQLESYGEYSLGIVPNVRKRIAAASKTGKFQVLQTVEKSFQISRAPLQWFLGSRDPDTDMEYGLSTLLTVQSLDSESIKGEVEVQRILPEAAGAQKKSFPSGFDIPFGSGFYFSGTLPHEKVLDNDRDLFVNSILKVMLSPAFQKKDTEFLIIFEFAPTNLDSQNQ